MPARKSGLKSYASDTLGSQARNVRTKSRGMRLRRRAQRTVALLPVLLVAQARRQRGAGHDCQVRLAEQPEKSCASSKSADAAQPGQVDHLFQLEVRPAHPANRAQRPLRAQFSTPRPTSRARRHALDQAPGMRTASRGCRQPLV